MQKKFGIVVIAAIHETAQKPAKVSRPGVLKSSRRRILRRVPNAAAAAA